jgi:hypothetical protein
VLRRIALTRLRQDQTVQAGLKAKRLTAGWDDAYLRRLLALSMRLPWDPCSDSGGGRGHCGKMLKDYGLPCSPRQAGRRLSQTEDGDAAPDEVRGAQAAGRDPEGGCGGPDPFRPTCRCPGPSRLASRDRGGAPRRGTRRGGSRG